MSTLLARFQERFDCDGPLSRPAVCGCSTTLRHNRLKRVMARVTGPLHKERLGVVRVMRFDAPTPLAAHFATVWAPNDAEMNQVLDGLPAAVPVRMPHPIGRLAHRAMAPTRLLKTSIRTQKPTWVIRNKGDVTNAADAGPVLYTSDRRARGPAFHGLCTANHALR